MLWLSTGSAGKEFKRGSPYGAIGKKCELHMCLSFDAGFKSYYIFSEIFLVLIGILINSKLNIKYTASNQVLMLKV
jgi:hypothetical protein